jgi:hypothetical protein
MDEPRPQTTTPKRRRPSGWLVAGVAAVLTAGAVALLAGRSLPGWDVLEQELRDRGDVLFIGGSDLERLASGDTRVRRASDLRGAEAALAGGDGRALSALLRAAGIARVVVDARRASAVPAGGRVSARLASLERVEGFRGRLLSPVAGIYDTSEPHDVSRTIGDAMARVARELLVGARAPRFGSFPEIVRRPRGFVEVLIVVREHGAPKLWRSSRGSSIARGLLTAAQVARGRWAEREQALGGPIETVLSHCEVELALIDEDGTIEEGSTSFIDRVITPVHGVGYERRGAWRYHLPEQVHRSPGVTGVRGFERLFDEFGVAPTEGFARRDLRLYRLVVTPLGRSPALPTSVVPPSPPAAPASPTP